MLPLPGSSLRMALAVAVVAICACSRTPSPLTPNLTGSVGLPHQGVLRGGVELPRQGPGYRWYDAAHHHHFGVPRLVTAVERVAAEVARERPGGPPLLVGELSKPAGGVIEGRHRSHRTGRDVDLLFYSLSLAGEPVPTPGFVRFGGDGIALVKSPWGSTWLRLDVDRQWLLVRALLLSPEANVQWLLVSQPIEALLTEYALARGEDPVLVWHAAVVMLQPTDSLPHDDHMHLRTACLPEEAVAGCEGGGPYWPWLPQLPATPPPVTDETLVAALLGAPGGS